jgi:hypothetical protein
MPTVVPQQIPQAVQTQIQQRPIIAAPPIKGSRAPVIAAPLPRSVVAPAIRKAPAPVAAAAQPGIVTTAPRTQPGVVKGAAFQQVPKPVKKVEKPVVLAEEVKAPTPASKKELVTYVQPSIPHVVTFPATAHTINEALKKVHVQIAPTSAHLVLHPKEQMAIPEVPPVIRPRPYGTYPLNSQLFLPEKPPEGHTPLAKKIKERLKERPPIHEPEAVIAEDLSIKDAKEQ